LAAGDQVTVYTTGGNSVKAANIVGTDLMAPHAYVVTRVDKDANGVWRISLENPWGSNNADDVFSFVENPNLLNSRYDYVTPHN
jgi:hypothetical protein